MGMKSEEEAVALQAIEFWTSVAEEETNLESDYLDAQDVRNGGFFPWVSCD
jgi:importin subunit beta-1